MFFNHFVVYEQFIEAKKIAQENTHATVFLTPKIQLICKTPLFEYDMTWEGNLFTWNVLTCFLEYFLKQKKTTCEKKTTNMSNISGLAMLERKKEEILIWIYLRKKKVKRYHMKCVTLFAIRCVISLVYYREPSLNLNFSVIF